MNHEKWVQTISDRWNLLNEQIDEICEEHGIKHPTVVAVSKKHPVDAIVAALDVGIHDFGENYAQELIAKAKEVGSRDINWHFIGPLQRRHAKDVASIAMMIHAVETERVMNRLANLEYNGSILIEFNLSGEESKHGVRSIDEVRKLADLGKSKGLNVRGLMVMANPRWTREELVNKFKEGKRISQEVFGSNFLYSAGMTNDWKEALLAGSTHLRIGTGIFGPRA